MKTFSNSKRAKVLGSEDDGLLSDDDYLSTDEEINKFHIQKFGDSFLSSNEDENPDELDSKNKRPVTRSSSSSIKSNNSNNYVKFTNNLKKIKNLNQVEDVEDDDDNQIPLI